MTPGKNPAKSSRSGETKTTKKAAKKPASKTAPKSGAKKVAKKTTKKTAGKKPSMKKIEEMIQANAKTAATVCDERRATDILVLDVRGLCAYADALVIATASSLPQMKGMVKAIESVLYERGVKVLSRTGTDSGAWVLLDCGDFLVHLFDAETRDYYQLEEMYGDAPRLKFETAKHEAHKAAAGARTASTRQRLKISRASHTAEIEIIDEE